MRVVLLHALPLDARMWEPQQEALARHEVTAPTLYPLGGSMDEWAAAVEAEVEGDFLAVGASMGGYCALALARRAPERLRGLALLGARADADTPERRAGRADTIRLIREHGAEGLWREMRPKLFSEDADPVVVERARRIVVEQDPEDLVRAVEAIRDRPDSTDVVEKLDCPLLVIVGDRDPFVPMEDAETLALQAPLGHLVVVTRCGHLASLQRPGIVNAALSGLADAL